MKKTIGHRLFAAYAAAVVLACTSNAALAQTVSRGEVVAINYTCSAPGEGVFETTVPAVAEDNAIKKTRIFKPGGNLSPAVVIAGGDKKDVALNEIEFLHEAIRARLAKAIVGKIKGGSHKIELKAETPKGLEPTQRYLYFSRVEKVPRSKSVDKKNVQDRLGKEPQVGDVMRTGDGQVYAKITAVGEDKVTRTLSNDGGFKMKSEYGEATSSGDDETVWFKFESEVGRLVRTGNLVGQVVEINEKNIIADFSHPFGGRALECNVEIVNPGQVRTSENQVKIEDEAGSDEHSGKNNEG